jgi:hypothetical protein
MVEGDSLLYSNYHTSFYSIRPDKHHSMEFHAYQDVYMPTSSLLLKLLRYIERFGYSRRMQMFYA